ncbi:MAG: adenylosuccinate synthase [Planctomycetota bacterium]|nr:MAG: adenylosuccinate synthase [Planctomycetota bacterium]
MNDPAQERTAVRRSLERSCAVAGLQWGDEGKGKIVDLLAEGHDAVVRYNGGANAGHTVVVEGRRVALHLVPCGVLRPGTLGVIGPGVVVDPEALVAEIDALQAAGLDPSGLRVSSAAPVVMPYHIDEDQVREGLLASRRAPDVLSADAEPIGTTRRGIGPAYAEKAHRASAVRMGDLTRPGLLRKKIELAADIKNRALAPMLDPPRAYDAEALIERALALGERLAPYVCETRSLLRGALAEGRTALFEGANGALLDIDHGGHPFVTSSSTTALGIGPGTGIPTRGLGRVVGVMKAYQTRVGAGPMPTELADATGDRIRERGQEFGTTTGRPRRCGWLDLVSARHGAELNDCDAIALTMLDVLAGFDELRVCVAYRLGGRETTRFPLDAADLSRAEPVYETLPGFAEEIAGVGSFDDLPRAAREYAEVIERFVGAPVEIVSVGPDRAQTIRRDAT